MPDISLLPDIAAFFQVTVDEVLGLKPLSGEEYIPVRERGKGLLGIPVELPESEQAVVLE